MNLQIKFSHYLRLILAFVVVFSLLFTYQTTSKADELNDLNAQIQQKQRERDATIKKINDIEKNISSILAAKGDLNTQLAQLRSEKKDLDKQIDDLEVQIKDQERVIQEYSEKLSLKEQEIQDKMNYVYKLTYLQPDMILGTEQSAKEYYNDLAVANATIELFLKEIVDYQEKIATISATKEQIESDKKTIDESRATVTAQIDDLQKKVNQYNSSIANANGSKGALSAQASAIDRQLAQLVEQQRILADQQNKLIANNPSNGGTKDIASGQIYFYGRGRDAMQGHGIGFSQYGAVGAALKGWKAEDIVKFYYPGSQIITVPDKMINVAGYGVMSANDYVAGLGEVPDKACEDTGGSFNVNNPYNNWGCWPREAIKAQMIVARSYGVTQAQPICTTDSCQVYKGGKAKQWASEATADMYVALPNGSIFSAYYSSDNTQGYGTASSNTVWSNNAGVGTYYSHLQSVNDSAFALKTPYNQMEWRTNGYTVEQIHAMLVETSQLNLSYASYIRNTVLPQIGQLQNIRIDSSKKDPSKRVKAVTLVGTNGKEVDLAGWAFKDAWIRWTANRCAGGKDQCDYIFSLTFDYSIR